MYNFYQKADGSGIVGIFISFCVYFGLLVLNAFIFYNYLVFLHMEGRLIDIYTRVSADASYFFIPFDNEVSEKYLKWIIAKIRFENNASNGKRNKHAAVTYHTVQDPDGNYRKDIAHITIYRRSK